MIIVLAWLVQARSVRLQGSSLHHIYIYCNTMVLSSWVEFENALDNLSKQANEVIIAGDYDIDLLNINEKPIFNTYFDTITS